MTAKQLEIAPGMPGAQVWEMSVIHRIFRRQLGALPRLVIDVPPGAAERRTAVLEHLDFALTGLHNHHETEDEIVWPLLLQRASLDADLIHRMEQQHRDVAATEPRVRASAEAWDSSPSRESAEALASAIRELATVLSLHLDEEEQQVVPLLAQHLTAEEWEGFGQAAFEKFPRSAAPLMVGQMLEAATPDEARAFLAKLPTPVKLLWPLLLRRKYAATMAAVRGAPPNPALVRVFKLLGPRMVAAYRSSGGKRMGKVKGLPVLLLTVPGRKSGIERTTPMAFLAHTGGWLVAGSGGGSQREPDWFRNLRRAQTATIEVGSTSHRVDVRVLQEKERDEVWRDVVLPRAAFFADYERKGKRYIPLALLTPR